MVSELGAGRARPAAAGAALALASALAGACAPPRECVDRWCVAGGDRDAADRFGRLLRDAPEGDPKASCDYWLGLSLRLSKDAPLAAFLDQVRSEACGQDAAYREAELKERDRERADTLAAQEELRAGACSPEHAQAFAALEPVAAERMKLKLWHEREPYRIHAASFGLLASQTGVVGEGRPLRLILTYDDPSPEFHAIAFGSAPLTVRFDDTDPPGAPAGASRWTDAVLSRHFMTPEGYATEGDFAWYTPKYRAGVAAVGATPGAPATPPPREVVVEGSGCVLVLVFAGGAITPPQAAGAPAR